MAWEGAGAHLARCPPTRRAHRKPGSRACYHNYPLSRSHSGVETGRRAADGESWLDTLQSEVCWPWGADWTAQFPSD